MPKSVDVFERPKRTKAEREAAKAARKAERPVRDHPKKGQPKPAKKDGGVKNPKAVRVDDLVESRVDDDGEIRISKLDPTETVSGFIIVPVVATIP